MLVDRCEAQDLQPLLLDEPLPRAQRAVERLAQPLGLGARGQVRREQLARAREPLRAARLGALRGGGPSSARQSATRECQRRWHTALQMRIALASALDGAARTANVAP